MPRPYSFLYPAQHTATASLFTDIVIEFSNYGHHSFEEFASRVVSELLGHGIQLRAVFNQCAFDSVMVLEVASESIGLPHDKGIHTMLAAELYGIKKLFTICILG